MNDDVEKIKARVTLRAVMEMDGIEIRRNGASMVACCPFHNESSPSFVLHEANDGDWFKCFGCGAKGDVIEYWMRRKGCDFKTAKDELMRYAGLSVSTGETPTLPKREAMPEPVNAPALPLSGDEAEQWDKACAEIYLTRAEVEKIANWRGYRPELVEWAARRGLVGKLIAWGAWREAFAIMRPWERESFHGLETIGWHLRLAPHTRNNESNKASWRYSKAGLGAWPFVVLPNDDVSKVKYLFCCEGQWDALALIDLMGWDKAWPANVAVVGMRGASSWKKLLEYALPKDVVAFLIADNDDAGRGWFVKTPQVKMPFSQELSLRVKWVYGFWPSEATGTKDLNDLVKSLDERSREAVRNLLRSKIQTRLSKIKPSGPTFFLWLSRQAKREDSVALFAKYVKPLNGPKGRARKRVWERWLVKVHADEAMEAAFELSWKEWEATYP